MCDRTPRHRFRFLAFLLVSALLMTATPALAFDTNPDVQDEPCQPESVFDPSCDGGPGDPGSVCHRTYCKTCTTSGCASERGSGYCGCEDDAWIGDDGAYNVTCYLSGSCSTWA